MSQVFKPQDFRLLRKPCKRYQTDRTGRAEHHTANPLVAGAQATYAPGAHGTSIGNGCYRSLPTRGHGHN